MFNLNLYDMTRKDYTMLAEVLNPSNYPDGCLDSNTVRTIQRKLAGKLAADNSKFNWRRFDLACGVNPDE